MEELRKISPDKERARSLVKLASLRYGKIKTFDEEKESSLIAEGYYEVAKELITAILFADGYKTLSHKDLIEYLGLHYSKEFNNLDITLLDHLRRLRNNIVYYGSFVEPSYIKRNKEDVHKIISKLLELCDKKLNK